MHCGSFGTAASRGWLRLGGATFGGDAKLNAEVMSPTTPSRQAVRLGTGTPNRARMSFNCEVWSNVSWTISPPRLHGEMTRQGTRKPRPIGPRMPAEPVTALMSGTVTYSPGVPGGAVGGATWSKKPPFSSYMMISAVFSHTAGLDSRIRNAVTMATAPSATGRAGCSDCMKFGTNQETCGSLLALTSAAKSKG